MVSDAFYRTAAQDMQVHGGVGPWIGGKALNATELQNRALGENSVKDLHRQPGYLGTVASLGLPRR